jgi:hypothetical protein
MNVTNWRKGVKGKNIFVDDRYRDCSLVDRSHSEEKNGGGYIVCTMKELNAVIADRKYEGGDPGLV